MFHFSYRQEIYDEKKESKRYYLSWRNEEKNWNYHDCTVTIIGMNNNRARIVLRRKISGYSNFMKSDYEVNLMMGFIALNVRKETIGNRIILVFEVEQSNDRHHRDISNVNIWSEDEKETKDLYDMILQKRNNESNTSIIDSDFVERNNSMVPVIYQPKIDAWKNFLREINVYKENDGSFQITLVFQNEALRKHGIFDMIYRVIRLIRHKRIVDIETFSFKNEQFFFKDIYSGERNLFDDTTHYQKTIPSKYYFQDHNHPVVFVNTSNHALAPHDNNHDLWKWEYVPWSKKIPIKLGGKTRQETEKYFQKNKT